MFLGTMPSSVFTIWAVSRAFSGRERVKIIQRPAALHRQKMAIAPHPLPQRFPKPALLHPGELLQSQQLIAHGHTADIAGKLLVGQIGHHGKFVNILFQGQAQGFRIRAGAGLGQILRPSLPVGKIEQLVLPQLLGGGAATVIGFHPCAIYQQQRVHQLLLVVHPVGFQHVVSINQGQHRPHIPGLLIVVPVFDQGHPPEIMGHAGLGLAQQQAGKAGGPVSQPLGGGIYLGLIAAGGSAFIGDGVKMHPEQGIGAYIVGIDHKGAQRIQRGGPGLGLRVAVNHLHAPAIQRRLPGQLHIHPGYIGVFIRPAQGVRPVAFALIGHRCAHQICRGNIHDVPGIAVGQMMIGQPFGPPSPQNGGAQLIRVPQPPQLRRAPQMLVQAALQKLAG